MHSPARAASPRAFANRHSLAVPINRLITLWKVYGRAACVANVGADGRAEAQGRLCLGDFACVVLRSTIMGKVHEAQKL